MRVKSSTSLIVTALVLTAVSTVAGFIVSPGGYLAPLASPPLIGATGELSEASPSQMAVLSAEYL